MAQLAQLLIKLADICLREAAPTVIIQLLWGLLGGVGLEPGPRAEHLDERRLLS